MRSVTCFLVLIMGLIIISSVDSHAQQDLNNRYYTLGVGDRLRVVVYGEENLSGEYEVGAEGTINLPLIGEIRAADSSISQLEDSVEAMLAAGYLKSPNVSIEVLNYRPFYILGEVNAPGSYPYVNGMTVLNAVALAGGFTYRADEDDIMLSRSSNGTEVEVRVDTPLLPGDILTVEERFF